MTTQILHDYMTMALNIRNRETEQLATNLANMTGETKTEAVRKALLERMQRIRRLRTERCLADELDRIATHCASLPVQDDSTPEQMLYDENGLPK